MSSASLNDLPTVPNTPEKQAERSAHATNPDGPSFNDFIFHDKTSKSSVQISTLLLPIRIFIRVYEVVNNNSRTTATMTTANKNNNSVSHHVSVSSFSQFQEESLLQDYFSHQQQRQTQGDASFLHEDSSHTNGNNNLNYDESFLQNSKNYDKAGSDKNVFMAILRLSDLSNSTSKLIMNNKETGMSTTGARNRNSSSSRGRGVIINPNTSSKKETKSISKQQDIKPEIATSTTSPLLTEEEKEAKGHFHNKLWNVEYLSIGNGYLAPVFCQNSETNPFAPLMVPLVFKTQQQQGGKRRGRATNREDDDEEIELDVDEEDDEQKMMLSKKRTSNVVNRRTVVVDMAQPIAYPTTATKKKTCWSASCGFTQLFSSWSPSSTPLQFHIIVEKNSHDNDNNNKINRNWNFSMLTAVGSIGFPSYVPSKKGDEVSKELAIRKNAKARTAGPFSTQELLENSQKILSQQQHHFNFDDNFNNNNNGSFFDTSATTSQISLTLLPQQFNTDNSFASPLNNNGVGILIKNKNNNNNKELISDNISTVGRNTSTINPGTSGKKKQEKGNMTTMMVMMNDKLHESLENLLLTDNVKDEDGDTVVIPKSSAKQTGKRPPVKNTSGSNDSLILVNKQQSQRVVGSSVRKSKAVAKHESFASVTIEEGKKLAALISSSSGENHRNNNNSYNSAKLNIVTCGLQFSAKEEKWIAKFSSDFLMMNKNNQSIFPAEFIVVSSQDFNRSVKLMCALSTATRILSEDWISEAVDNFPTKSSQIPELVRKHLLETAQDFTVSRRCVAQFNSENCCDIETFVRRVPVSNRRSLLKGRKVVVEKNVVPQSAPNNDVKDVVIAFGGIPEVAGNEEGFGNAAGVASSSTRTSTGSNNGNNQNIVGGGGGGGGKRKSATVNLRFSEPQQGSALLLSSSLHDSALPPLILVTSEDKKDKRKNFAANKYAMDVNEFFRRILNLDEFS